MTDSASASPAERPPPFAFGRRLALIFTLLGLLLGLLLALHWILVLEPTLRAETESRAHVLAQAQAGEVQRLLNLSGMSTDALRDELQTALDHILLLKDGATGLPFVRRVVLTLDDDTLDLPPGRLNLTRGVDDCRDCVVTPVPLYRAQDHILIGIATFHASPQFLQQLLDRLRGRLILGGGVLLGLIGLAWIGVSRLLRRLAEREADLRGLFEVAPFPMMLHERNHAGLRLANAAAKRYLGLCEGHDGRLSSPLWVRLHANGLPARGAEQREVALPDASGESRWALVSTRPLALSGIPGLLISLVDVSGIKAIQDELRLASLTDPLTGLYNRRHLFQRLAEEIAHARGGTRAFSLILFDLDHFKTINDRFGHQVGDLVLARVAGVLRDCLREQDVPGRHGGEEFMVILPDCALEEARRVAERIRATLAALSWEQADLRVTISGGVREYAGTDIDTLIESADRKLYQAKRDGRNRVIG